MSIEKTHPWPTADVIYIDRANVEGLETFEPGVYLLTYDPTSHSRDYCRAGTQLAEDPDLGDKILEGIDEIISWYEVDTATLYNLFEMGPAGLTGGGDIP
jgi:hypothetical protein